MRKCESIIRAAVLSGESVIVQNTAVCHSGGTYTVYLHGNAIARGRTGELPDRFTLAGWNTVTTRSRLRALGVGVGSRDFAPVYNGEEIDSCGWYPVR